jgi:hypothetical protein
MSGDENSSLDSWAAEFNGNESLSDRGWSDDDDTSNEGSLMSEDSAVMGQNKPESGSLSHAEAHHADHGASKKKLKKNKYSSDPLAYRVGIIKQSSKMAAATADNDEEEEDEESALKSSAGANCADTDVFKMLVEMLLGSPSELFAMSAEHIAPQGDLPSFLACLDNKRPFFQCTGLVDELHSMHLGGQSLAHFLRWFIDAATEAELCKRFVSLDTSDIAAAVGSDPNINPNPTDMQALINTFKISVCKLSAHFEADVVRLEVEHNDIVRVRAHTTANAADTTATLKKGQGKEDDDNDDAADDVDFYASIGNRGVAPPDPYAAASAAFNRQWSGSGSGGGGSHYPPSGGIGGYTYPPGGGGGDDNAAAAKCGSGNVSLSFLGRGGSYQMSRSLLSLYTLCERWLPVLRSCSEFVKSLMVLVQELEVATSSYAVEGAYDDLALLCLGLVQAVDETIRSFQLELGSDHHDSAATGGGGGGGADIMMSGSSGSGGHERESKMQLRLRELHRSMSPSAWLAVTVQEDLFPAVLGYFIAVCEMARISNSHHMGSSSSCGSESLVASAGRAQQHSNSRPAMHAIEYPTIHTFSGLRAPLQADLAALHKSPRQRQRQPVQSSDTTEQQQQQQHEYEDDDDDDDDNAKWSSHSSLYEQKKERRGDGGSDYQSLRRSRQAAWKRAVASYQVPTEQPQVQAQVQTHRTQTKSQENGGGVSVSQASSRGKYHPLCLPAVSLLQVTVLQHNLRQARAAEVRDMQVMWSQLRLHHRFDLMQTVYFLGDESLFAGVKDVVESVFDVDTRTFSAARSPHSTGNNSSSPSGTGRELDYRMLVRRQLVKPHTTRNLKLHLASAIEDKLRTFVNTRAAAMSRGRGGSNGNSNTGDVEEELHLSVTSDLVALEEDERRLASSASSSFDGEGEARALMRMVSYLSVRVHCTRPLSLVLSESLCLCYESILSFLLSLSTCKWVCERVRLASKASILASGSPRAHDGGVSPALIAGNSFKKDCHVTLGLLHHVLGAVKASLQVQAHQVGDYRNYASRRVCANTNKEDAVVVVSLSLEELQRASLYMMQEMVKVFAQLQPALIALTNAAASFCDRFVALLRAEAGVEGQAAFDMESLPCMHLQGQLLAARDAMTQFVRRLDALLVVEPTSASGATARHAEAPNNTCLLQLRNKLRTLFQ